MSEFYHKLMLQTDKELFRNGNWLLGEINGCPDNTTYKNLLSWSWRKENTGYLIVVNYSHYESNGILRLQWPDIQDKILHMTDVMNDEKYNRSGSELTGSGIYVALKPWSCHFFRIGI